LPYPAITIILIAGFKNRMLRFVSLGILHEATGRKRNNLYIASDLIKLLSAPDMNRF